MIVATGNITNVAELSLFEANLNAAVRALGEADFVELGPAAMGSSAEGGLSVWLPAVLGASPRGGGGRVAELLSNDQRTSGPYSSGTDTPGGMLGGMEVATWR